MWSVSFVWHKCRMRAMPPFGRKSMADVFRMIKQLCCILIINTIVQFLVNCMFQPLDMFAPLVYGCFALQLLDPSARTPVSHRCVCVCVYSSKHVVLYLFSLFGLVLCCCQWFVQEVQGVPIEILPAKMLETMSVDPQFALLGIFQVDSSWFYLISRLFFETEQSAAKQERHQKGIRFLSCLCLMAASGQWHQLCASFWKNRLSHLVLSWLA